MKKILLGLVAAFAFTTVAPLVARAADEGGADAAKTEKAPKKKSKKKKADEGEKKDEGAK